MELMDSSVWVAILRVRCRYQYSFFLFCVLFQRSPFMRNSTDVKLQFGRSMTVGCAEDVLKLKSGNLLSDGAISANLTSCGGERMLDCEHIKLWVERGV